MELYDRGQRRRKTSPEQRDDIRRRFRAGEKQASIAASYGITPSAVAYHVKDIDRPLRPHGTPAAYRRHQAAGQKACQPCLAAWNDYCRQHPSTK